MINSCVSVYRSPNFPQNSNWFNNINQILEQLALGLCEVLIVLSDFNIYNSEWLKSSSRTEESLGNECEMFLQLHGILPRWLVFQQEFPTILITQPKLLFSTNRQFLIVYRLLLYGCSLLYPLLSSFLSNKKSEFS